MNKLAPALMTILLVTGCVHPQLPVVKNPPPPPPLVEATPPVNKFDTHIAQCSDELDALQAYNLTVYQQYKQRFDRLNRQLDKYMEIRANIGSNIDDIAMPKYQYSLRNLCFDIRSELTQQIVKAS